eukprot:g2768.t1
MTTVLWSCEDLDNVPDDIDRTSCEDSIRVVKSFLAAVSRWKEDRKTERTKMVLQDSINDMKKVDPVHVSDHNSWGKLMLCIRCSLFPKSGGETDAIYSGMRSLAWHLFEGTSVSAPSQAMEVYEHVLYAFLTRFCRKRGVETIESVEMRGGIKSKYHLRHVTVLLNRMGTRASHVVTQLISTERKHSAVDATITLLIRLIPTSSNYNDTASQEYLWTQPIDYLLFVDSNIAWIHAWFAKPTIRPRLVSRCAQFGIGRWLGLFVSQFQRQKDSTKCSHMSNTIRSTRYYAAISLLSVLASSSSGIAFPSIFRSLQAVRNCCIPASTFASFLSSIRFTEGISERTQRAHDSKSGSGVRGGVRKSVFLPKTNGGNGAAVTSTSTPRPSTFLVAAVDDLIEEVAMNPRTRRLLFHPMSASQPPRSACWRLFRLLTLLMKRIRRRRQGDKEEENLVVDLRDTTHAVAQLLRASAEIARCEEGVATIDQTDLFDSLVDTALADLSERNNAGIVFQTPSRLLDSATQFCRRATFTTVGVISFAQALLNQHQVSRRALRVLFGPLVLEGRRIVDRNIFVFARVCWGIFGTHKEIDQAVGKVLRSVLDQCFELYFAPPIESDIDLPRRRSDCMDRSPSENALLALLACAPPSRLIAFGYLERIVRRVVNSATSSCGFDIEFRALSLLDYLSADIALARHIRQNVHLRETIETALSNADESGSFREIVLITRLRERLADRHFVDPRQSLCDIERKWIASNPRHVDMPLSIFYTADVIPMAPAPRDQGIFGKMSTESVESCLSETTKILERFTDFDFAASARVATTSPADILRGTQILERFLRAHLPALWGAFQVTHTSVCSAVAMWWRQSFLGILPWRLVALYVHIIRTAKHCGRVAFTAAVLYSYRRDAYLLSSGLSDIGLLSLFRRPAPEIKSLGPFWARCLLSLRFVESGERPNRSGEQSARAIREKETKRGASTGVPAHFES